MPEKKLHKNFDYIIVGQGIAGSLLSFFLLKKDRKVLVIDNNPEQSSSKVAAGIINYITGRRFVKSWLADLVIPFAQKTYEDMEGLLNKKFYYPLDIYKPIFTSEEYAELSTVIEKKGLSEGLSMQNADKNNFIKPHKAAIVAHHTAYVNMKALVVSWRKYLSEQHNLLEEVFDYSMLSIENSCVYYKDYVAARLIFCEGYQAIFNPFFKALPFNLAHGDTLTIKVSGAISFDRILSKGIYIVPLGENIYKVGATYLWNTLSPSPTETGKKELLEKLDKIIGTSYEVIEHNAGIRPTVKDRRPFLGLHPEHPQIGIFNGMGTKGASLAPYFASHLIRHMEEKMPLMEEVDIRRYMKDTDKKI